MKSLFLCLYFRWPQPGLIAPFRKVVKCPMSHKFKLSYLLVFCCYHLLHPNGICWQLNHHALLPGQMFLLCWLIHIKYVSDKNEISYAQEIFFFQVQIPEICTPTVQTFSPCHSIAKESRHSHPRLHHRSLGPTVWQVNVCFIAPATTGDFLAQIHLIYKGTFWQNDYD